MSCIAKLCDGPILPRVGRTAAAISAINKDAPAAGAPRNLHSVEDFKDDPKARLAKLEGMTLRGLLC